MFEGKPRTALFYRHVPLKELPKWLDRGAINLGVLDGTNAGKEWAVIEIDVEYEKQQFSATG